MKKITFPKPGTMLYPVPTVMVSCGDEKSGNNITTVAWTGTINSEPPMLYISLRKTRFSHEIIKRTGEFVINLTSKELVGAMDYCGVKSGRDVDKFKEKKLTAVPASQLQCPMIFEAPVNIECKVNQILTFPSHDMFIADVIAVHAAEALMNPSGKFELERAELIAFSHGGYYDLPKRPIGTFGYAVRRRKTINQNARKKDRR